MRGVSIISRCQRAADKALAPAKCNVAITNRNPLIVTIRNVPGQTPLTAMQRTTAKAAAEAVNPAAMKVRLLVSIRNDLTALTVAQKTAVWDDLTSGTPPKFAAVKSENTAAMFVLKFLTEVPSLASGDITAAKMHLAALYVQDVPFYLEQPAFAPTVNISGLELA